MEIFKFVLLGFLASSVAGQIAPWEYLEAFEVEGLCSGEQTCSPEDCIYEGPMRPNLFFGSHASCDCHFLCLYLGTCCLNFEEVCLAGYSKEWFQSTYPNQEAIPQLAKLADGGIKTKSDEKIDRFMQLRQRVITVELIEFYQTKFPLVTRCPYCGTGGQCNELKEKCESSVTTDWAQLIYVSHDGVVFKNKFCAECYHNNSFLVVKPLGAGIVCKEELLESDPFALFDKGDYSGIFNMINVGQCWVQHNSNELEDFVVPEIVSGCDTSMNAGIVQDENFKRVSDACSSYVAYVEQTPSMSEWGYQGNKIFRNKHCAICNGVSVLDLMNDVCYCSIFAPEQGCISMPMVPVEFHPIVPFFSIALDFAEHAKLERLSTKLCNGESQDVQLPSGKCIDRYCPQDAVKVNTQCAIADSIEIYHEIGDISLGVRLEFPRSLTFEQTQRTLKEFRRDFLNALGEHEADMDLKEVTNTPQRTLDLIANAVTTNINLLVYKLTYDYEVIMKEITEAMNINYMMITINAFAICPQGFQEKILSDFMFVWLGEQRADLRIIYAEIASYSAILFPEFEVKLDPSHHKLTINISQQGGSWHAALNLHFCYKIDTECLDACGTLGSSCGNCTLYIEPLRKLENPKRESADEDKSQWSDWEVVSTFVLAILSILALISCLIMHRVFPDLMKKGGRAFTQLLISLLGAEVGLLIGSFQVWGDMFCSLMAALQHYAWLASFFWTTVMSWDVFCIFVLQTSSDESSQSLYLRMLVGWASPLLIVSTCGVLHVVDLFKYGGNGACWISGALQLGLSFGLPVGTIIVINLVFYALIIRQLTRDMDSARAVGRPYDPRVRFLLCCKLSTIVGFTWVFGFLANIPGLGFFKHVFSVCAGLNGTMVALAFTISSKTIQVIRCQFAALRTATQDSQPQPVSCSETAKF